MAGFGFNNVGFVGSLGLGAPVTGGGTVNPYEYFARFDTTALHFPALPVSGLCTLAMWLRADAVQAGQRFVLDNRGVNGENLAGGAGGFAFGSEGSLSNVTLTANGVNQAIVDPIYTGAWTKVLLESDGFQRPTLLARFSDANFLKTFIADLRVYPRAFTAVEKADATGPFPATPVLARYDFRGIAANVPDISGNGRTITYAGPAGVEGTTP